jgi:hypothetical protein
MKPVRVGENGSVQLNVLVPGAYYEPEIISADEIKLRRVYPPGESKKMTRAEALKAIDESPLSFTRTWDELKRETRE